MALPILPLLAVLAGFGGGAAHYGYQKRRGKAEPFADNSGKLLWRVYEALRSDGERQFRQNRMENSPSWEGFRQFRNQQQMQQPSNENLSMMNTNPYRANYTNSYVPKTGNPFNNILRQGNLRRWG